MPLEKIIDYSHPDKKSQKHCIVDKGKKITIHHIYLVVLIFTEFSK